MGGVPNGPLRGRGFDQYLASEWAPKRLPFRRPFGRLNGRPFGCHLGASGRWEGASGGDPGAGFWVEKIENFEKNIEKGFSKKTILSYETDFRKFLNFLCWHKNYKDVDLSILSKDEFERIIKTEFNFKKIELTANELFFLNYNQIRPYLFFIFFLNYKNLLYPEDNYLQKIILI